MSDHPITEDELHAYIDDVLDAARRANVLAYLDAHPEVAERIEAYRTERKQLRSAFASIIDEPLPPELNLRRMIETRMIQTSRRPFGLAPWVMGAVASVLLSVGGVGGWTLRDMNSSPVGLMALGRDAAASYTVYAGDKLRPVEIRAEDRNMLTTWAAERIGHPVAIPELTASGYRFMGGRVLSTPNGAAALFMYDDDKGRRLVVLTRPMSSAKDSSMTSLSVGGVNGFTWSDSDFGYSMVGAVTPDVLRPLADEVRRQVKRSG